MFTRARRKDNVLAYMGDQPGLRSECESIDRWRLDVEASRRDSYRRLRWKGSQLAQQRRCHRRCSMNSSADSMPHHLGTPTIVALFIVG